MTQPRFRVQDSLLFHGDTLIGPTQLIHVDHNELRGENWSTQHHDEMPHRIDLVMVSEGKVIGAECKRVPDLLSSFESKRLARQFRTLREQVDLPVLIVRGNPFAEFEYTRRDGRRIKYTLDPIVAGRIYTRMNLEFRSLQPLFEEFTRWQMLGAVVLFAPEDDAAFVPFMLAQRALLGGTRNVLSAIAGTDRTPPKERAPGWLLRRIPSIGRAASVKAHTAVGSTAGVFAGVQLGEGKKLGLHTNQIVAIEEALK